MRQALHIFRKDVRCFWYEIAIVLAITIDYAYVHLIREQSHPTVPAIILVALMPIAWPYLVTRVVQEEALPGERQFWITRPYARASLLAAKILFILAFLHLPLLLADALVIGWHGFSPVAYIPGLVWRQFAIFAALVLPAAALAAITRNLVEMLAALFVSLLGYAAISILGRTNGIQSAGGGGMYWIPWTITFTLWCAAAVAILIWQYRRRGTILSRAIAASAVVVTPFMFPSLETAWAIQSHFPQASPEYSSAGIVFDPGRRFPEYRIRPEDACIPIRITGLPPGADYDLTDMQIRVGDSNHWRRGDLIRQGTSAWLELQSELGEVRKISLSLTIFTREQVTDIPPGSTRFRLPGAGVCYASATDAVECMAPLRTPAKMAAFPAHQADALPVLVSWPVSYSPFPAEFLSGPMVPVRWMPSNGWTGLASHLIYVNERPVAHLVRELELPGIRLADYTLAAQLGGKP